MITPILFIFNLALMFSSLSYIVCIVKKAIEEEWLDMEFLWSLALGCHRKSFGSKCIWLSQLPCLWRVVTMFRFVPGFYLADSQSQRIPSMSEKYCLEPTMRWFLRHPPDIGINVPLEISIRGCGYCREILREYQEIYIRYFSIPFGAGLYHCSRYYHPSPYNNHVCSNKLRYIAPRKRWPIRRPRSTLP